MNAEWSGLRRLRNDGANNADPAWSPDGSKLAAGSDREGGNNVNIYTMTADGGNVTQAFARTLPVRNLRMLPGSPGAARALVGPG